MLEVLESYIYLCCMYAAQAVAINARLGALAKTNESAIAERDAERTKGPHSHFRR